MPAPVTSLSFAESPVPRPPIADAAIPILLRMEFGAAIPTRSAPILASDPKSDVFQFFILGRMITALECIATISVQKCSKFGTMQCSKCDGVLDTTGTPKWCRACRAKYKREYEATVKEMTESRGYAAGVSAMRDYLAQNFAKYGSCGSFSGYEISQTIKSVRFPIAE